MGNNQPKANQEESLIHQRLGPIKIEQDPTKKPQSEQQQACYNMYLNKNIESQRVYQDWLKELKQVQDTQTREILLIPQKHDFQPLRMCGSNGTAKLKYEYYEFVLQTEVQNRFNLRKDFLETELWYLLYNMVRAGYKFQHLKRKIGNIHPNNILINESGQIKIISTCSFPGEVNNYEHLIEFPNQIVYLAPQEVNPDLIQKGKYPTHVDPCLAEVFSIGLTMLSSGTLQSCDSVYGINPYQIKRDRINYLLKIFRQKYGGYLFDTVASMVAFNPNERRRSGDIYNELNEYENQILDLEPFTPQNRPMRQSQGLSFQNPPQNNNYRVINQRPSYTQHPQMQPPQQHIVPPPHQSVSYNYQPLANNNSRPMPYYQSYK